jgi:Mce-associated membrane protein
MTATADTDAESAAETETEVLTEEATETPSRRPKLSLILLVAAVVIAAAGVWFTLEARSISATPSAANTALTDVGATAEVNSAVTVALNKIFSYSYDRTDVTEKAAATALRGKALESYNQLFTQVKEKAPAQKLVLTTRVSSSAVQELRGDKARLLVFLDQAATRADNNSSTTAAAQLSVTAEREGENWVITDLVPR